MKASEVLKKVADLVGIELSTNGSKQYAKLKDGGVICANLFENGNVVLIGDGPSALGDGEYEVMVDGENGAQLYKLVVTEGLISQFELLPKKATQMSEEIKTPVALEEVVEPKDPMDEEKKVEEKMSIEDVVAALDARLKVIEDYMKADEAELESKKPMMEEEKKEEKMSKQKKFNAAPLEEKKMTALVNQSKNRSMIDSVWERMNNFK